jgi:hypothetical protein
VCVCACVVCVCARMWCVGGGVCMRAQDREKERERERARERETARAEVTEGREDNNVQVFLWLILCILIN